MLLVFPPRVTLVVDRVFEPYFRKVTPTTVSLRISSTLPFCIPGTYEGHFKRLLFGSAECRRLAGGLQYEGQ